MSRQATIVTATLVVLGALIAVGGCAYDQREWMKLDGKYTVEDFRRDHAACSASGKLDDGCMRTRGWVAVNPKKVQDALPGAPIQRSTVFPGTRQ
jgi:hypothetical protein